MALTDIAIRQAKPAAKQYKLADGAGLYLLVTPAGGKLWRLKYRLAGKEKLAAFGAYPEVSLADARKRRDEAREQIAANKDPSREKRRAKVRQRAKAMNTFAIISAEYCAKRKKDGQDGWAPATAKRSEYLLSRLNAALVRPAELRHARWDEIDLEGALWTIPAEKTKMRKVHRVPLSRQAVAILREIHALTGPAGYVFPSVRTRARPMSENTLNAGLRRLGYASDEMTAHGFRAMAATLLNESGKWHPDAIERALAHGEADKVRAAYTRGAHWQERVEMAQWWSNYLDQLRKGADIVPFPEREAI